MWQRQGILHNFFLAFIIDEVEKQVITSETVEVG